MRAGLRCLLLALASAAAVAGEAESLAQRTRLLMGAAAGRARALAAERARSTRDLPLDQAVMTLSKREVAIAEANAATSHISVGEAKVHMAELATTSHLKESQDAFDLARAAVPVSRASSIEAKMDMERTVEQKDLMTTLIAKERTLPQLAADEAAAAIMQQVKQEAIENAVSTAGKVHDDFNANADKRMAGAVAGDMVKYHLSMIRAQKASAEYKAKADSAQQSAMLLNKKAQQLAADAQAYQDAGDGYHAQMLMWRAHGTMNNAVKMQAWAKKMDGIARKVGGSVKFWSKATQEKAANTAATYSENPPMPFPSLVEEGHSDRTAGAGGVLLPRKADFWLEKTGFERALADFPKV